MPTTKNPHALKTLRLSWFLLIAFSGTALPAATHIIPASTANLADPAASIQAVLNAAQPGDTVQFTPATYYLDRPLELKKRLKLVGDPLSPGKPLLQYRHPLTPPPGPLTTDLIRILADQGSGGQLPPYQTSTITIEIKKLKLSGGLPTTLNSISYNSSPPDPDRYGTSRCIYAVKVSNITIENCEFKSAKVGIWLEGQSAWRTPEDPTTYWTSNFSITQNEFEEICDHEYQVGVNSNNNNAPVYDQWGRPIHIAAQCQGILVANNTIKRGGRGGIFFSTYGGGNLGVRNAVVRNNIVTSKYNGLKVNPRLSFEVWYGSDLIIENNQFDHWVSIAACDRVAVRKNTIKPVAPDSTVNLCQVELVQCTNVVVTDNQIEGGNLGFSIEAGKADANATFFGPLANGDNPHPTKFNANNQPVLDQYGNPVADLNKVLARATKSQYAYIARNDCSLYKPAAPGPGRMGAWGVQIGGRTFDLDNDPATNNTYYNPTRNFYFHQNKFHHGGLPDSEWAHSGHGFRTYESVTDLVLDDNEFSHNVGSGLMLTQYGSTSMPISLNNRFVVKNNLIQYNGVGALVNGDWDITNFRLADLIWQGNTINNNGPGYFDSDGTSIPGNSGLTSVGTQLVGKEPRLSISLPLTRTPGQGVTGASYTFTPGTGTGADGVFDRILWDMGEGSVRTNAEVNSHVYSKEGKYTVTAIAWDKLGRAAKASAILVCAQSGDTDGDGMTNREEVADGTNPAAVEAAGVVGSSSWFTVNKLPTDGRVAWLRPESYVPYPSFNWNGAYPGSLSVQGYHGNPPSLPLLLASPSMGIVLVQLRGTQLEIGPPASDPFTADTGFTMVFEVRPTASAIAGHISDYGVNAGGFRLHVNSAKQLSLGSMNNWQPYPYQGDEVYRPLLNLPATTSTQLSTSQTSTVCVSYDPNYLGQILIEGTERSAARGWVPPPRAVPGAGYRFGWQMGGAIGSTKVDADWGDILAYNRPLKNVERKVIELYLKGKNGRLGPASGSASDWDSDTLQAWEELELGTNPTHNDTDGDTLPDNWEADNQLNPTSAVGIHGSSGDPDQDGRNNDLEFTLGTNPWIPN